jgi:hypothetical protein
MPWYIVRWTEKHEEKVQAKDEEDAVFKAEVDYNKSSYQNMHVEEVEYLGPDQDEMDYDLRFKDE